MISILVIKNGIYETDIKNVIKDVSINFYKKENINIDMIESISITDKFAINIVNEHKYDGIIILGGCQSLTSRKDPNYKYQYLNKLIDYTKNWILNNINILGICLGSQIIAEAMGYNTKYLGHTEIGYGNIDFVSNCRIDDPLTKNIENDDLGYVFKLHNDYSNLDSNNNKIDLKIFAMAKNVTNNVKIPYIFKTYNAYGIQFHPEITIRILKMYQNIFSFDNSIVNYALTHYDNIKKTTNLIFRNWLEIISDHK